MLETGLKETEYASHKHDTGSYSSATSIERNPDLCFDKELVAKNSHQYADDLGGTQMPKCDMCQFGEKPSSSAACLSV